MLSSTRQAIACLFLILSTALLAQSQTVPVKEPLNTVSGKVTIKDKPVQGMIIGITLRDRSGRPRSMTYKGTTDVDGEYRITNVPAGNYSVLPLAPAFVTANESGGERTLILSKGETIEHFDFELMRGGVITGKVVDADERPVVEQEVQIVTATTNNRPYFGRVSSMQTQTDDRGIYRIYGLRPGNYKVSVGQSDSSSYGRYKTAFYKQVYYPSTTDAAQATVIEVSEGSEAANIDITLGRAINTFTASGRMIDENGQPLANVNYGFTQFIDEHHTSSMSNGAVTNSRGEFKLENLLPGKYAVSVRAEGMGNWNADPVPFEIVDEDITGLVVKPKRGATVSGVVVLEGTDDKTTIQLLKNTMVAATVSAPNNDRPPSSGWSRLGPDGSFAISGLTTGTAVFQIGSSSRFRIVRTERNGVVQPRGVEVKEGEPVSGVRVVVNYANASLRGVIEPAGGTLPPGARFYVYLRIATDPSGTSVDAVATDVDARGQFVVEGLLPGTYEINAGITVGDAQRTEVRGFKKQMVEITAGSSNNVTVTVELTPVTPRP